MADLVNIQLNNPLFLQHYEQLCRQLNPERIFKLAFGCMWINFFWTFYILWRQYRLVTRTAKRTPEIEQLMDEPTFARARLYSIHNAQFNLLHSIYSQLLVSLLLIYQAHSSVWKLSKHILQHYGYVGDRELAQTMLFTFLSALFFSVQSQPWNLYRFFVIEERAGFNKYTIGFYFKDVLKSFVLGQMISLPVVVAGHHIIRIGGSFFFLILWAFYALFQLLLTTVYQDFIAPLFNTFIPLPDGQLKTKVEKLASSIQYPLARIFVVNGSIRSGHSNAYLTGMFNKRTVVLFDTLIDKSVLDLSGQFEKKDGKSTPGDKANEKEGANADEILAVLGHEFGHWQLNHLPKQLVFFQVLSFVKLYIFSLLYQNDKVFAAFGFLDEKPVQIGLTLIFNYIFQPINEVTSFMRNQLSRKHEFQADAFAKHLGHGENLKSALIKMNKMNIAFPLDDWLYSRCKHSHPPLFERLAAIGKCE